MQPLWACVPLMFVLGLAFGGDSRSTIVVRKKLVDSEHLVQRSIPVGAPNFGTVSISSRLSTHFSLGDEPGHVYDRGYRLRLMERSEASLKVREVGNFYGLVRRIDEAEREWFQREYPGEAFPEHNVADAVLYEEALVNSVMHLTPNTWRGNYKQFIGPALQAFRNPLFDAALRLSGNEQLSEPNGFAVAACIDMWPEPVALEMYTLGGKRLQRYFQGTGPSKKDRPGSFTTAQACTQLKELTYDDEWEPIKTLSENVESRALNVWGQLVSSSSSRGNAPLPDGASLGSVRLRHGVPLREQVLKPKAPDSTYPAEGLLRATSVVARYRIELSREVPGVSPQSTVLDELHLLVGYFPVDTTPYALTGFPDVEYPDPDMFFRAVTEHYEWASPVWFFRRSILPNESLFAHVVFTFEDEAAFDEYFRGLREIHTQAGLPGISGELASGFVVICQAPHLEGPYSGAYYIGDQSGSILNPEDVCRAVERIADNKSDLDLPSE